MAEYSREEFAKMQEQAASHAQPTMQMGNNRQRNSQQQKPRTQQPQQNPVPEEPQQNPASEKPPQQSQPPKKKGRDLLEMLNFKNLELDSDRITIIALALMLSAEEADELLIMALIYIML